jgi:hypothetical protein
VSVKRGNDELESLKSAKPEGFVKQLQVAFG